MIESLIVGLILVASLFFFLRYALLVRQSLLIDEFIESTLICLASKKTTCIANFRYQLVELHLRSVVIHSQTGEGYNRLNLSATSSFDKKIEKESELTLDLKVH